MNKRFLLLMALLASSAFAQQNTDISAEQFTSGDANGTLSALGRQAAASGKRLVVTAPQHWHAQIAAKIRAGGNADVVLKDGFYETVLVRIEDKAAEPARPEPKPEATVKAEPKPAPPPARANTQPAPPPPPRVTEAPAPAPVVERAPQTPPPAAAPAASPPPAPVEAAPEAAPIPAAAATEAPAATVDPSAPVMLQAAEPGDTDPVRSTLEKRYNEGKRITELLETSALRRGDLIYTAKGAAVVVRREGSRLLRFWLVGALNLNQIGIGSDGVNKYKVLSGKLE
ncbi:hypothetical protein [Dokdonella immobilis]|uniref:Uncharacterized protein n=1 Tax=Dokdonella immobilis TaxID=578942 RepID=A0A1I4WLA5_9GAMM|nr:hypothetical protein [Dokdonella immobilis]SFN14684.1 hypothetical protein SAMN05216289_105157 [Dokdonella immobilis]